MALKSEYTAWFENKEIKQDPAKGNVDWYLVMNEDDYEKSLDKFKEHDKKDLAVDTETTGLDHTKDEIVGFCWAFDEWEAYYMPVAHKVGENVPRKLGKRFLEDFMYPTKEEIYFYHARFDLRMLREDYGLEPDKVDYFDISQMAYNMDMNVGKWLSLKYIYGDVFDWPLEDIDVTKIALYPPKKVLPYGGKDALATYLFPKVFDHVLNTEMKQPIKIDQSILPMIMEMEEVPKYVDKSHYEEQKEELQKMLKEMDEEIYEAFGQEINLNSPKQKREAFKELGIDTGVETETGKMSTGKEALRNIKDEFDVADKMIERGELEKHGNTYIEPYIEEYREDVGGFYLPYQTAKADTGRLAGGSKDQDNPFFAGINCQGIKKDSPKGDVYYRVVEGGPVFGYGVEEVDTKEKAHFEAPSLEMNTRHGIKPQPNCYWLSVDYSGQELRILANESRDETMLKIFLEGDGDLHTLTTENVLDKYGDYKRKHGKILNFSIGYGAQEYRISNTFDVSLDAAGKILDTWWNTYPGVKNWVDRQHKKGREKGYVTNHFGRVFWVKHLFEGDWLDQKFGERKAQNCVDEETEILTKSGWKYYNELEEGEFVLTKNRYTGELEWNEVNNILVFEESKGDLVEFDHETFSAVTTDNHRWWVYNKYKEEDEFKMSRNISKWGDHRIHRTGDYRKKEKKYPDYFVEFAGWFLTDGSIRTNVDKSYICQSYRANKDYCKEIESLLERVGVQYSKEDMEGGCCYKWHFGKDFTKKLRGIFPDRNLTEEFIFNLSDNQVEILFETMLKGDGYKRKNSDSYRFCCSSKRQADLFQILCVLNGRASTVRRRDGSKYNPKSQYIDNEINSGVYYIVNVLSTTKSQIQPHSKEIKESDGRLVWCPQVDNETFIARRGEQKGVYITGNSPIQGGGADVMKIGSRRVWNNVVKENRGDAFMELQVHDEQCLSLTRDREKFFTMLEQIMDYMCFDVPGWEVPMEVDAEVGTSFGLQIPLKKFGPYWTLAGEKEVWKSK